mmetsp:Transcript_29405/g.86935  ORF Transcript_29405/g.86935 Transcript_29405/m.86935 type:complete len:425 (-) Transcript_29405:279-1553(-)
MTPDPASRGVDEAGTFQRGASAPPSATAHRCAQCNSVFDEGARKCQPMRCGHDCCAVCTSGRQDCSGGSVLLTPCAVCARGSGSDSVGEGHAGSMLRTLSKLVVADGPVQRTQLHRQQPLQVLSTVDRAVGVMLGGMCGNVLGAELEGASASQIMSLFPEGVTDFISPASISDSPSEQLGIYTVDTQMGIALARSLLEHGRCDPAHASASYAREFQPHRGYHETQCRILDDLRNGVVGWRAVATRHIPQGSYGNGGAMRIAPLGVAYRHASPSVLRQAVEDALVCTHVHEWGIDGAYVQASAVGWLCSRSDSGKMPAVWELLDHLQHLDVSQEMHSKLHIVVEALHKVAHASPSASVSQVGWSRYWQTESWGIEMAAAAKLANGGFLKTYQALQHQLIKAFTLHHAVSCARRSGVLLVGPGFPL